METVIICRILHKIGRFNKVYMELDGEWITSTKTIEDFEEAVKRREIKQEYRKSVNQKESN